MRLDQLNLNQARVWVRRGKNSLDTEQPIEGDELRAIKRYLASRSDKLPWLFVSERGQPLTRQAVNYVIGQAGDCAGLGNVWPHMLRHSAGFALALPGKSSKSTCWVLPPLLMTSRPNSLGRPLPRLRCWERYTRVRR